MAKRFFLICGGVLMLAIAWRVAVPPAHAQTSATCDAGVMFNGVKVNGSAAASGRAFYVNGYPAGPSIPGSGRVVAVAQNPADALEFLVMLDDGAMYRLPPDHSAWAYWGNSINATAIPTVAHQVTFGALKVKYR